MAHIQLRLRTQSDFISFSISANKFLNPYSEQFEYVVATHMVLPNSENETAWQTNAQVQ